MNNTNYEIKAKVSPEKQKKIKEYLRIKKADFIGKDPQTDTYFKTPKGRLKIRKGNIENKLIYYERENKKNSKKSEVLLFDLKNSSSLEKIIKKTNKRLIKVKKEREIYFIDNVKFHIDYVKGLGNYIEIEAISKDNLISLEKIKKQCEDYKKEFEIKEEELVDKSYSDLLINKKLSKIK